MATLNRKHTYKNGGASYGIPGVRASIYVGPRMFSGAAPDTIEFDASNLATPDTDALSKKADREAKQAERKAAAEAKKAEREAAKTVRAEAKLAKQLEREQAKADRKAAREQKQAEAKLAREQAKAAKATPPVPVDAPVAEMANA